MSLEQFVSEWNGKAPLYAPNPKREYLRGQCVQLAMFYCVQVLGVPVMWKDAANWWHEMVFPQYFDKVGPNDLQRGDIAIWDGRLPGSDGDGHIAIVLDGRRGQPTFVSFDSNWGGKYAHQVTHNRSYLLGGLRRKGQPQPQPAPQPQGEEMIANADQAIKIYKMLRPNGGPSQGEIDATAGRRTFGEFLNSAQGEMAIRDANLRAQAEQLGKAESIINELNKTITEMRQLEAQEDLTETERANEYRAAQEKISYLTTALETANDKIKDLQAADIPQEAVVHKQPSLLTRLFLLGLRFKKK